MNNCRKYQLVPATFRLTPFTGGLIPTFGRYDYIYEQRKWTTWGRDPYTRRKEKDPSPVRPATSYTWKRPVPLRVAHVDRTSRCRLAFTNLIVTLKCLN
ncbi:hypothetical protein DPMN_128362 [Dreissena polymorpha]|uniref:Uncharacterized protein n=1 Tax=Dreissena polymorpha TaxID=45954 RepID=A0A9D4GZB5_DREPO|nr:hypothetical protein DPMN_128362 [Dreissena polymorpha]